jgi:hypothetical protein
MFGVGGKWFRDLASSTRLRRRQRAVVGRFLSSRTPCFTLLTLELHVAAETIQAASQPPAGSAWLGMADGAERVGLLGFDSARKKPPLGGFSRC